MVLVLSFVRFTFNEHKSKVLLLKLLLSRWDVNEMLFIRCFSFHWSQEKFLLLYPLPLNSKYQSLKVHLQMWFEGLALQCVFRIKTHKECKIGVRWSIQLQFSLSPFHSFPLYTCLYFSLSLFLSDPLLSLTLSICSSLFFHLSVSFRPYLPFPPLLVSSVGKNLPGVISRELNWSLPYTYSMPTHPT